MGFRTSVEYVSDYVESVDSHVGYGLCQVNDELPGRIVFDDSVYDLVIVFVPVRDIVHEEQLIHDI